MKGTAKAKGAAGKPSEPSDDKTRYTNLIVAAAEKAPEKVKPYLVKAAPVIAAAVVYIQVALPYIVFAIGKCSKFIAGLPEKVLYGSLGFAMCFCGGIFPATIAAAEAWNLCGGGEAIVAIQELYGEFLKLQDASKKDDDKDEDGDGVRDVDQIQPKELLARKTMLALRTVDPERFNGAISGIYTGWIGVLAILKIQFAKTITLGEVIGEKLYEPASRLEPQIKAVVPEEYHKVVPMALRWTCKAIAISIAWWIQRVISAFHSAIRGGLMFGRYFVNYLHEKGVLKVSDEDTYMDEAIGWSIAALGFLFQLAMGFGVPFPLNILLLPVQFVETFIVWSVAA